MKRLMGKLKTLWNLSPGTLRSISTILVLFVIISSIVIVLKTLYPAATVEITQFSTGPEVIELGETSILTWEVSGVNKVTIEPNLGVVNSSGSYFVFPAETTTYKLTASDGGKQTVALCSVTVKRDAPLINSFEVNPAKIVSGNNSTLSWSVSGGANVIITPEIGNVELNGSKIVRPTTNTTYTITATNEAGSDTVTRVVTVEERFVAGRPSGPRFSMGHIENGNGGGEAYCIDGSEGTVSKGEEDGGTYSGGSLNYPKTNNTPAPEKAAEPKIAEKTVDEQIFTKVYVSKHKQPAKLIFNPSEKMKVGETENIDAYITTDITKNTLEDYRINETLQSRDINITPRVKVTLVGGETGAFDIKTIPPNSDGVQPIIKEDATIWSWQVTPLKSGRHTLLLSIEYVIPLSNGDYQHYKTLKNIEEKIEVETNRYYLVECHWEWIVGTIIAIATLLLSIYKRGK